MQNKITMNENAHTRIRHFQDSLNSNTGTAAEKKSFKDVLKDLAESSSLHGVPKIISTRQIAVKILWCFLFVATSSVLAYDLIGLFRTFYSYPVQTTVSLEFSSISFPAISICNMNPVRKTELESSDALLEAVADSLFYELNRNRRSTKDEDQKMCDGSKKCNALKKVVVDSDKDKIMMIQPSPVGASMNNEHISSIDDKNSGNPPDLNSYHVSPELTPSYALLMKGNRRRKREATTSLTSPTSTSSLLSSSTSSQISSSPTSLSASTISSSSSSTSSQTSSSPTSLSASTISLSSSSMSSFTSTAYDPSDNHGSWAAWSDDDWNEEIDPDVYIFQQLYSKKDEWEERVNSFRTALKMESQEMRRMMGHQKKDFIMSVSFDGVVEKVSQFQHFTSSEYGNCFTMSSPRFAAWRSGPTHGIKMTLNVEIDEYIPDFTTGYGVRLLLHEPGTYPLPSNEGITLSPGTETYIGLKMVHLTRLGQPYGNCTEGQEFSYAYSKKYSMAVCHHFCRIKKIMEVCQCIPVNAPDEIHLNTTMLPVCNSSITTVKFCLLTIDVSFNNGTYLCDCNAPCQEIHYERTISSRYWPSNSYMKVLLSEMCKKKKGMHENLRDVCDNIDDLDFTEYEKLRTNFLRVLIYFEDLNFETIHEEPLYESVRFLSDIGGAMGLFLGASVLSFVEVLQLLLEIVIFMRQKVKANTTTKVKVLK